MNSATAETTNNTNNLYCSAACALRDLGLYNLAQQVESQVQPLHFIQAARKALETFPAQESRKAVYALRMLRARLQTEALAA
jgi:hypothetical protein